MGDPGLIPELGISPGGVKGYPLQHSGLVNSMDLVVHGVTKSWTRLSDFHFFFAQITPQGENTLSKGQRVLGRPAGRAVCGVAWPWGRDKSHVVNRSEESNVFYFMKID